MTLYKKIIIFLLLLLPINYMYSSEDAFVWVEQKRLLLQSKIQEIKAVMEDISNIDDRLETCDLDIKRIKQFFENFATYKNENSIPGEDITLIKFLQHLNTTYSHEINHENRSSDYENKHTFYFNEMIRTIKRALSIQEIFIQSGIGNACLPYLKEDQKSNFKSRKPILYNISNDNNLEEILMLYCNERKSEMNKLKDQSDDIINNLTISYNS